MDAHVKLAVAAKPKLVQISTAYGKPAEGSPVVPRNQYVEVRQEKSKNKYQQDAPEYKTCKHTTEAIVADGSDKGEIRKVCANPECPVHHPKKHRRQVEANAAMKVEEEKRRREEATAQATGLRVLAAIGEAVPVRLMKRDLLFVAERLANLLDENRLAILARQHGIRQKRDDGGVAKTFAAFLRRADESTLGRAVVESAILLAASRGNATQALRDAAIRGNRTKTNQRYRVRISESLAKHLEALGEPAFPGTYTQWRERVNKAIKDAGVKTTPHGFRHYRITEWLSAGVRVDDVADMVGSSPNEIRKTYRHWIKEAEDRLDEVQREAWLKMGLDENGNEIAQ